MPLAASSCFRGSITARISSAVRQVEVTPALDRLGTRTCNSSGTSLPCPALPSLDWTWLALPYHALAGMHSVRLHTGSCYTYTRQLAAITDEHVLACFRTWNLAAMVACRPLSDTSSRVSGDSSQDATRGSSTGPARARPGKGWKAGLAAVKSTRGTRQRQTTLFKFGQQQHSCS